MISSDEIKSIALGPGAVNAGLGILGKNTLLLNRHYGNMVYIGAVLIDKEIDPDPMVNDVFCPCREFSYIRHPRGWEIYTCNACRKVCPNRNGKN